jgi:hypothetical protein
VFGALVNSGQRLWGCEDDGNMGFVSQLASEVCDYAQFCCSRPGISRFGLIFRV